MSTKVMNPCHRDYRPGFKQCAYCHQTFTTLGLPRHWNHCKVLAAKKFCDEYNRKLEKSK